MPATNLRKNSRVTPNNYTKFSNAPSMEEVQNAHAICITCWLLDLECNHKSPCSCCKAAKFRQCYYIRCPSNGCKLSNKCPAYHTTKETSIATFNSLHLLALVKIPYSQLRPESLKALRATLDAQNVQWLFGQMREKLKSPPPGVQIDEDYIKTLIVGVLPAQSITQESLDKDARFIMNFVDETRYANICGMMFQRNDTIASIGPFYELWMREEKIQKRSDKFASLGSSA